MCWRMYVNDGNGDDNDGNDDDDDDDDTKLEITRLCPMVWSRSLSEKYFCD